MTFQKGVKHPKKYVVEKTENQSDNPSPTKKK